MALSILALDCATEACSVALWYRAEITGCYQLAPRESTQLLLPMVQKLLSDSGLCLQQLDALAFTCGPGSFTGIRIGIGIAQGLALGASLPVLPISTLKTLAQGAWRMEQKAYVVSAIDARMSELYWGVFQRQVEGQWQKLEAEQVITPAEAENRLAALPAGWSMAGSGWPAYPQLFSRNSISTGNMECNVNATILLPDAQDMLPLALDDWKGGRAITVEQVEPVYLRNEVAWRKLPGR